MLEDRISQFDRPHRFTFAGVYELPIGRGRKLGNNMNRVLDAFIGGWQLNGTYEWQSGEPFLLTNNLFFPGDVSTIAVVSVMAMVRAASLASIDRRSRRRVW